MLKGMHKNNLTKPRKKERKKERKKLGEALPVEDLPLEVKDVHGLPQRLQDHGMVPAGQPSSRILFRSSSASIAGERPSPASLALLYF
jgi:hypothetical protein